MSNGTRNAFVRKKLQRTAGPPPAANARSQRRTEKKKTKTARIEETASEIVTVTGVVTTATRTGKETAIVTVTVNGIGTATMIVEEGSIIDEMIMTTVIDPRETTGTGIIAIDHQNITRITIGMRGGGTASIGMTTAGRRVEVKGNVPPRRSGMRGARR